MVYNGVLRLLVRAHTYPSQGAIEGGGGLGGGGGGGGKTSRLYGVSNWVACVVDVVEVTVWLWMVLNWMVLNEMM